MFFPLRLGSGLPSLDQYFLWLKVVTSGWPSALQMTFLTPAVSRCWSLCLLTPGSLHWLVKPPCSSVIQVHACSVRAESIHFCLLFTSFFLSVFMKWDFSHRPLNQMSFELILLILFSHFLGTTVQQYRQQTSSRMLVASNLEKISPVGCSECPQAIGDPPWDWVGVR